MTQVWFQNSRARQKKHMHTGKVKTQCKLKLFYLIGILFIYIYFFKNILVHSRDDSGNFGRHINLHLTYSFQQQGNNKSSLFAPTDSSLDELSQESTMHCMQGEV